MGNIAEQNVNSVKNDRFKDEIMSSIMDENPQCVIDNGTDGIADDDSDPNWEIRATDDGEDDIE